jgi:hypothetical protein
MALEQRAAPRLSNGMGAAGDTQVAKEIADMFHGGSQGDHQRGGDLLIRGFVGEQTQILACFRD